MRIKATLLAALAAALIVPAAAQASSVDLDGNTIVYRLDQGTMMSVGTWEDWNSGNTYLYFSKTAGTVNTDLCENDAVGVLCHLDPNRPIRIEGSAARDDLQATQIDPIPDSVPLTINGNGGNDKLQDVFGSMAGRVLNGGPGDDEILGYHGNDTLDGGDGNDDLDGGENDDLVLGGTGNDDVDGDGYKAAGSDVIDGGPGYDYVDGWTIPEDLQQQPAVDISLDGAANDGRPGESDNVTNVEDFAMNVVGSYTGTDGPEKIHIVNPGNSGPSKLIGRGGDDQLIGHDFNDAVDGGAGADTVEGGYGNDTVTGGPGQDTIYGDATSSHCTWYSCKVPFGNDVINARDGEVDSIDCGFGTDRAIVDTTDIVAGCETVDGAAPAGGGSGGSGGGGGSGRSLKITVGAAKLRAVAARGLAIKVPWGAAASVRATMTADRATARRIGTSKVATARRKLAKAGTAKLTLKPSRAVGRKLKRLAQAKMTIKVTVTPKGGAAVSSAKKVTLKR